MTDCEAGCDYCTQPVEQGLIQTSLPSRCVIYGAGWVVLLCGLHLATRCVGSGASGRDPGGGEGQSPFVPLVSWGRSYKVICDWLPLVRGLEELGRGYAMNWGQLPLVLGLESLGGHHNVSWSQAPLCQAFDHLAIAVLQAKPVRAILTTFNGWKNFP